MEIEKKEAAKEPVLKQEKIKEGSKVSSAKSAKKTEKKVQGPTITIKQLKSGAGRFKNQIQTLKGLGLGKVNKVAVVQDNPSIRGMIKTVQHLVQINKE